MELHSLQSPALTTISTSLPGSGFARKSFLHGQVLKFPICKKYPDGTKLKFLDFRAQASGTTKSKSVEAIPQKVNSKDEELVFVAGATGKVGSRMTRELLKLGFRVRAGVRSAQKAGSLVQSVEQMKLEGAVEKLELVECDLEKPDQIGPALGSASVVICCIGASEKEVFDITGPYRIDYQATKNLIDAATDAKVDHFIMVSSLGTNKIGFPAAILNLFWGVLIWKRKAEEALIASGLPYTIVRPGGMERPTDAYKETHNITLSPEDTLFGGQVSNLQVAELMAFMAKNRGLSYCKVVEVIAETTAPLTPLGELLAKIPSQRVDVTAPKRGQELDGATVAEPAPIKTVVSVAPSAPTETEPVQEKAVGATALSPFTAYEDSKPPTSPAPASSIIGDATEASDPSSSKSVVSEASTTPIEKEPAQSKAIAKTQLSPYIAYDDLKPPTSPAPAPPSSQKEDASIREAVSKLNASDTQTSPSGATTSIGEITSASVEVQITGPLSPYAAYENLKPPSSPSPTASGPRKIPLGDSTPLEVPSPSIGGNNVAKNSAGEKEPPKELNHRHSPYHVYEDLKPPTSPVPLPRKF